MFDQILADMVFPKRLVSLADSVSYGRPRPLRNFDQIYMMSGDMLAQVELMKNHIASKRIVFLGDGDGMSMLFGLLASERIIERPKRMLVLDFDKRIIANIEKFSREKQFKKNGVIIDTHPYNVIDPVPPKFMGDWDFFYINPPYGSRNFGRSTIIWLERCMDLCTNNCSGCLVIPYDEKESWSQEAMLSIQKFLTEKGFVVRDMASYMHYYHLPDNPVLQSSSLVVDRIGNFSSNFTGKKIPPEYVFNLYGSPRPLPHYIEVEGDSLNNGSPDYNWDYGRSDFGNDTYELQS
ncbi:MAG TPA: bis-aminopropyl spermidine synthase family protein [Pyrinomonadaceae bacterium]|jgi:predicted methyltransferase